MNAYFNVAAFTKPGDFFGNAGRNILRGPVQRNTDFSVSKHIPITEKLHAEFRSEFFNIFNLVNFANPAGNLNSSGVGIIKGTNGKPAGDSVCAEGRFLASSSLCYGLNVAENNPWTTLGSRIAYANAWLRVREDKVLRPDGQAGLYGVVEIRPSIGVLVFNHIGEAALVGQWRYPLGRYSWEIVRGGSSEGETDMLAVARRELREETGYDAAQWLPLGPVDVCNGVTSDVQHLFVARELSFSGVNQDPVEQIETRWTPFDRVVRMALDGEISEVCSVAAILRYAMSQA